MAKVRVMVEFEISGPDANEAADAIDAALDEGTIQDAIEDAREAKDLDFTIGNASILERRA